MKNSWRIFTNDIKKVGTNWVAAIILGGLVLLPSLYAWLNIEASWDPYSQTNQIPVAVVNEDLGETVRDKDIHVGQDIVDSLKENQSMEWHFIDQEMAMDQLNKGDLFAVVVIPEDFSENLGTVIQSHPKKAQVEYYVNEKINAISPKITEKGASVIVEEVSRNFISTVNGVIFEVFNEIGLELEKELPDIKQFEKYIFDIEDQLPDIHETLEETLTRADSAQDLVAKAKKELPQVESTVEQGMGTINRTTDFLQDAENRLDEMGQEIKKDLAQAQKSLADIQVFIEEIQSTKIDFSAIEDLKTDLTEQVNVSIDNITAVEDTLAAILAQLRDAETPNVDQIDQIETTLAELADIKAILIEGRENTEAIADFFDEKSAEVDDILDHVTDITLTADERLDQFTKAYEETIEPTVLAELKRAKDTLVNARDILVDVQDTLPEVEKLLNDSGASLDDGKVLLEDVIAEYPYLLEKITGLANKIRKIQDEADINEIIDLLQNDPEAERGFFAEPVLLNENKLFPIENYGSGMTPFYTVLSLWVGGLLLISLLSTSVSQPELFTSREVYFGKMFFFLLIGFLQTLIVTGGDILLIGVNMANPVWFVVFGLFCSVIFVVIIYTLVSIFGDVGKAMAIVMLVLQIAGSGGTYPVVLLPKFFQAISPFLPFTYAVDIMREPVGGIVWGNVIHDLIILAIFGLIAIIFGALLKEPINRHTNKLVEKSSESGVFH